MRVDRHREAALTVVAISEQPWRLNSGLPHGARNDGDWWGLSSSGTENRRKAGEQRKARVCIPATGGKFGVAATVPFGSENERARAQVGCCPRGALGRNDARELRRLVALTGGTGRNRTLLLLFLRITARAASGITKQKVRDGLLPLARTAPCTAGAGHLISFVHRNGQAFAGRQRLAEPAGRKGVRSQSFSV